MPRLGEAAGTLALDTRGRHRRDDIGLRDHAHERAAVLDEQSLDLRVEHAPRDGPDIVVRAGRLGPGSHDLEDQGALEQMLARRLVMASGFRIEDIARGADPDRPAVPIEHRECRDTARREDADGVGDRRLSADRPEIGGA